MKTTRKITKAMLLAGLATLPQFLLAQIQAFSVTTPDSGYCSPDTGWVTVSGSELGVEYHLLNSQNAAVAAPQAGSGQALVFTFPVTGTETYHVQASAAHSVGLALDGTNDYITTSDTLDFAYQSAYTYEAWVKTPNPSTGYYNPVFYVGTPGVSDIEIYVRPNDFMALYDRGKPGLQEHRFPLPPNSTWFHLAVVYNGSTTTMYYNGVQQSVVSGTPNGSLTRSNGASVMFGYAPNITTTFPHQKYFDGMIDDIRIWSVARSASEISSNMSACLQGNEPNLELHYRLNGAPGDMTTADATGSNTGILTNVSASTAWQVVGTSSIGCASTATTTLPGTPTITLTALDNSISQSGGTLTAVQSGANYQWMDCGTFAPVPNATLQSFTPSQTGQYACIVTLGECADTSACQLVTVVGLDAAQAAAIEVAPNPSLGTFHVVLPAPGEPADLRLCDLAGREIATSQTTTGQGIQVATNAAAGAYILHVRQGAIQHAKRIVIR